MDEDKGILIGGLVLLALAIALLAVWRVWIYRPTPVIEPLPSSSRLTDTTASDPVSLAQQMRRQELMDAPDLSLSPVQIRQPGGVSSSQSRPQTSAAEEKAKNPIWKKYPDTPSALNSVPSFAASSNPTYPTTATTGNVTPVPVSAHTVFSQPSFGSSSSPSDALREQLLAPYLLPRPDTQKKLNNNLKNLGNYIALALQKFLTPKSKKETNIEKYLRKTDTSSQPAVQADPLQEMMTQIGEQKNEIVQNVTQAFGAQAGQRAGALMADFERDLSSEISKTDQDAQKTVQNIQKITQNYQQKLEKMNQENQYNQYVENVTQDYNKHLQDLQELYAGNTDLQQELSRIYQQHLTNELSLSSQHLTPQEYTNARYENYYALQKEAEAAVKKMGASLEELHKYNQKQEENQLKMQQQLEEEGKIISIARTMSKEQTEGLSNTLSKERNDILSQVEQAYGEETVATVKPILENYYQQMMQTAQEELTDTQRMRKQAQQRLEANRKILDAQMAAVERMNLPQEQKEQALQQLEKEQAALQEMEWKLRQQEATAY